MSTLAICALAAVACVPPTLQSASSSSLTPKAQGKKVWGNCSGCHSGSGPSLKGLTFTKIKEGMKKPAMASFKDMSDDDVAALMAYLATLN